jgi:anti-anti-sigma regulatory factor
LRQEITAHSYGVSRRHRISAVLASPKKKEDAPMSTETAVQPHITYELIDGVRYQVVVIELLSRDITTSVHARELGDQLQSLIRPQPTQYFVVDCSVVRALGSSAFSEILSFVQKARPVWFCNLDDTLRLGASMIGLDNWARFAANRRAAIVEAERTARWDEEDTVDYPAWPR